MKKISRRNFLLASPIETRRPVPSQDKHTFGDLRIHLVTDDRGIQKPFRLYLAFIHLVRIFIYLLKIVTGRKQCRHRE